MELWIIHHYASLPDKNGYIRPYRFAMRLRDKGIRTVVMASSYNHWSAENEIVNTENYAVKESDGVEFVFIRTPGYKKTVDRIKNMLLFSWRLVNGKKKLAKGIGKPDVILASSPHPFSLIAGIKIAKYFKVPCICEIRDLWPEAIFYAGKLKENSLPGKILTRAEHWIYKKADALVFTKEGDTDYLKEHKWTADRGGDIALQKCFYINNGIEIKQYEKEMRENILRDDELEGDDFKVIYAGAIRPVNYVENIVDAAKLLPKDEKIKILIYGDGNLREGLEKRVRDEHIDNVVFRGFVEKKYIPYILSRSSVNLLNYTSEKYNWARGNSSNKLFEYLASGRPVISTVKTGYSIIERYHCGIEMEKATPQNLADAILEIKYMERESYEVMCKNALAASRDFDYRVLSEKLYSAINFVKGDED